MAREKSFTRHGRAGSRDRILMRPEIGGNHSVKYLSWDLPDKLKKIPRRPSPNAPLGKVPFLHSGE